MRGILDYWNARGIAGGHDLVHVGRVSAHVADHHRPGPLGQLHPEVGHVDAEVVSDLDQNRHTIAVQNGGGDGGEGESGDQDAAATRQVERLQRQKHRGGTGRDGQRVTCAHQGRELGLEQRNRGLFGRIAEQVARLQQAVNLGAGCFRNRFGIVHVRGRCPDAAQSVMRHGLPALFVLPHPDDRFSREL